MGSLSVYAIRSKCASKLLVIIVLLWFIYSEFITYWTLHLTWFEQPNCHLPRCRKILLVSDPQIIGREWPGLHLVDFLAIWDSDRYLKRTFRAAVDYVKPDFVIFLGDLMDQGHIATESDFLGYLKRLNSIFELPKSLTETKVIFSPGDNDIGGVDDILVPENVRRFDRIFNQTEDSIVTDFIEFCKVNLMTATLQKSKLITGDIVRVVLSHVPLIPKENYFLREVVKKIRPHLIFSGHLHSSYHYTVYENDVWSHRHNSIPPTDIRPKMYKFHEGLIHEIIVPTCSYRMGVPDMGYGVAYIDTKKKLVFYSVLWLPNRFFQLITHFVLLTPLLFILLFWIFKKLKRSQFKKQTKSPTKGYSLFP